LSPSPSPSLSKRVKTSPRVSPSVRPPVAKAPLSARYMIVGEDDGEFVVGIEVFNPGQQPATWTVEVTYDDDLRLGGVWNACVQRVGNRYRSGVNPGGALGAAQKVQFGYIASGPKRSGRAVRCTINGRTCG